MKPHYEGGVVWTMNRSTGEMMVFYGNHLWPSASYMIIFGCGEDE